MTCGSNKPSAWSEMEEQVKMALQSVETYRRKAETAERRVRTRAIISRFCCSDRHNCPCPTNCERGHFEKYASAPTRRKLLVRKADLFVSAQGKKRRQKGATVVFSYLI